ncbi:MAG: hypothetical protein JST14_12835 [Bacteroidetes bacterium]|nr:hypothetical protein [Bacteroidota bacterium]
MKTAIIPGSAGQDGTFLADLLLQQNYRVIEIIRSYNNSKFIESRMRLAPAEIPDIYWDNTKVRSEWNWGTR